jgi:hypothetical protein
MAAARVEAYNKALVAVVVHPPDIDCLRAVVLEGHDAPLCAQHGTDGGYRIDDGHTRAAFVRAPGRIGRIGAVLDGIASGERDRKYQ